jgi:protein-S-isoprenylcysteine O-methyltransferase Ste14
LVRPRTTRHWSDWLGTAAFTAMAVALWRRSPEFGVLLLPGLVQELLIAASFLLRGPVRFATPTWTSRAVAYLNSFLVMVFILVTAKIQPEWLRPTPDPSLRFAGAILWLAAAVLCLWPLWYLRHSFSLEPQARDLVTSGPYRLARHPIYTVYLLINAGILLRHLTIPFALVLALWVILLLIRVRYEERVLTAAFPEYTEYRRRVRAFGVIG